VHVEGGKIYLTTLRKNYDQNASPLKKESTTLVECEALSTIDEDIRNLITRRNLDLKIHPSLAFSRHRKTLSF
jgi:hypothetical protein